jgi:SnoaL-like domain
MTSASLETRLDRVEAALAIIQVEGQYCRLWDSADAEGWAGLYTEDGIFEAEPVEGGERFVAAGRPSLITMCQRFHEHSVGLHVIGLPDIEFDDKGARARLHFQFRGMSKHGSPRIWDNFGIYDVRYVRSALAWRISRRAERAVSRDSGAAFGGFYGHGQAD